MKVWSLGSWITSLAGIRDQMDFDNYHYYLLHDENYTILGLKLIL